MLLSLFSFFRSQMHPCRYQSCFMFLYMLQNFFFYVYPVYSCWDPPHSRLLYFLPAKVSVGTSESLMAFLIPPFQPFQVDFNMTGSFFSFIIHVDIFFIQSNQGLCVYGVTFSMCRNLILSTFLLTSQFQRFFVRLVKF